MALQETSSLKIVFLDFFDVKNLNEANLFNYVLISSNSLTFLFSSKDKVKAVHRVKAEENNQFWLSDIFTNVLFFLTCERTSGTANRFFSTIECDTQIYIKVIKLMNLLILSF